MSHKEHIIEMAMRMFVQQGIKSVRMDDIAQELGISKRTLYEQFGDKEELLYLSLSRYMTDIHERIAARAAEADNTLESILVGFFEITGYSETNTRIMGNLRKFYPEVHERLHRELGSKGTERFKRAIGRCMDEGLLDCNMNIDLALTMLYYMALGIVARKDVILPAGVSARDAFINVVIMFFRGISTPEGMRIIDDFAKERFARSGEESSDGGSRHE